MDLANRDQALRLIWEQVFGAAELERFARAMYERDARIAADGDGHQYEPLTKSEWAYIWRTDKAYQRHARSIMDEANPFVLEAMRRAYALAESKEELARTLSQMEKAPATR